MQDWVVIVIYALLVVAYGVVHELIFRFRFKELGFTYGFLTLVFFIWMLAAKLESLFVWLTVVSFIACLLLGVYALLCMRRARDKMARQMQGAGGMSEMLNNIMSGKFFGENPDPFSQGKRSDDAEEEPTIIVTEEKQDDFGTSKEEELKFYDVGDVIVDEGDKNDDEKKEK